MQGFHSSSPFHSSICTRSLHSVEEKLTIVESWAGADPGGGGGGGVSGPPPPPFEQDVMVFAIQIAPPPFKIPLLGFGWEDGVWTSRQSV